MSLHLFLNQGFAEVFQALVSIKEGLGEEIRVTASHSDPASPYRLAADDFVLEPRGLDRLHYAAWFQEQAERLEADLVWPQRQAEALLAAPLPRGIRAIAAADVPTLRLLADKASTYRACEETEIPIPAYRVAADAAALREALRDLSANGDGVCVKPLSSTFGHGFRRIVRDADPLRLLLAPTNDAVSHDLLLEAYSASAAPAPLLAMTYLPGAEYSIDCLASHGRLLRHVARRKSPGSRHQLLTTSPSLRRIAEAVTARFRLNAVFNIQLREHRGSPYLLEVNARRSGGLPMAALSGLSFAEWAVRLAAGADPEAVPAPRYGSGVTRIEEPLLLPALSP